MSVFVLAPEEPCGFKMCANPQFALPGPGSWGRGRRSPYFISLLRSLLIRYRKRYFSYFITAVISRWIVALLCLIVCLFLLRIFFLA